MRCLTSEPVPLPRQFDYYLWVDETHAVDPLPAPAAPRLDLPETYPFGL